MQAVCELRTTMWGRKVSAPLVGTYSNSPNWMTPPTAIEEEGEPLERLVVRKWAGTVARPVRLSPSA
jgi:hypothetical protein